MLEKALALEGGSLRCMFSAGAVDVMMERTILSDAEKQEIGRVNGVENIQIYLQDYYLEWPYENTGIEDYKAKVES